MAKTQPTDAEPLADPASDRVVLHFTGAGRPVGAPQRDLTAADLARMAYRAAAAEGLTEGSRPDPRTPDQEIAAQLVDRLIASGSFSTTPVPAAAPAPTTPAVAATTTEG